MTTLTIEQFEALTLEEKLERLDRIYQSQLNLMKKISELNEMVGYTNMTMNTQS